MKRDAVDFGPRRSGRTTRIADRCVQEFFKEGYTICVDHHSTFKAHKYLLDIVRRRLSREHPRLELIKLEHNGFYVLTTEANREKAYFAVRSLDI